MPHLYPHFLYYTCDPWCRRTTSLALQRVGGGLGTKTPLACGGQNLEHRASTYMGIDASELRFRSLNSELKPRHCLLFAALSLPFFSSSHPNTFTMGAAVAPKDGLPPHSVTHQLTFFFTPPSFFLRPTIVPRSSPLFTSSDDDASPSESPHRLPDMQRPLSKLLSFFPWVLNVANAPVSRTSSRRRRS